MLATLSNSLSQHNLKVLADRIDPLLDFKKPLRYKDVRNCEPLKKISFMKKLRFYELLGKDELFAIMKIEPHNVDIQDLRHKSRKHFNSMIRGHAIIRKETKKYMKNYAKTLIRFEYIFGDIKWDDFHSTMLYYNRPPEEYKKRMELKKDQLLTLPMEQLFNLNETIREDPTVENYLWSEEEPGNLKYMIGMI